MHAELQVLSPLVPVRQSKLLRFCKQQAEGVWAVVDVSLDISQESTKANPLVSCRRLPSGFVVQDMPNGFSKVIVNVDCLLVIHSVTCNLFLFVESIFFLV